MKRFEGRRRFLGVPRPAIRAVDGVSFDIAEGETLGLVGESGCGKSTTGRLILRLLEASAGEVWFAGQNLTALPPAEMRRARREMQMVFQDPYASLNPRMALGQIVREPLDVHGIGTGRERAGRVASLLGMVGIDPAFMSRYPHQLSGGQRQRVGIARALATNPRFIVADEPLSSLDVSIQAQVVNLLADLKRQLGLTYLFIAHDLAMVRYLSDRVAVMYLGRIVELAPRDDLFARPRHPYTQALLAAAPVPDPDRATTRAPATPQGEAPSPAALPPGCRFHPRCPFATEVCRHEDPALQGHAPGQAVACHHAGSIAPPASPIQSR
jgi:oligopeptide/dipeptide ABC transporter ATP-binding protein